MLRCPEPKDWLVQASATCLAEQSAQATIAPGICKLPRRAPDVSASPPIAVQHQYITSTSSTAHDPWLKGTSAHLHYAVYAYFTPTQHQTWLAAQAGVRVALASPRHGEGSCCGPRPSPHAQPAAQNTWGPQGGQSRDAAHASEHEEGGGCCHEHAHDIPAGPEDAATGPSGTADRPVRCLIRDTRAPTTPEPMEIRVGLGFTVPCMETAVRSMRVGDEARFLVQPEQAEVRDPPPVARVARVLARGGVHPHPLTVNFTCNTL
jgi:hypothetical protein